MPEETADPASPVYTLEYVTSAFPGRTNDNILVDVVNDSSVAESTRVVIYKNTGAGAVTVSDTRVTVTPTWTWSLSFPVKDSSAYWLRIQATSESLIPRASVERSEGAIWKQIESYRPGDFAVFSLTRKRLW